MVHANAKGSAEGGTQAKRPRRSRMRRRLALFGEPAAGGEFDVDVAGRLRALRTQRGLSLRLLAEKSGLNVNTLSLIENGRTSPSVSTLQQVARAMEVPIAAFFEMEETPQEVVFQKAGQRPRAAFAHGIAEDLGGGMSLRGGQPLLVTLQPDSDSGPSPIVHTGQEFVFCLEGQLTYAIGDRHIVLEAGDSLIFEAHLPHRWGNAGKATSRSLLILCPDDQNEDATGRHFATASEPASPGSANGDV